MLIPVALLVALSASVCSETVRYDDYQVHRVLPKTVEQLQLLLQLESTNSEISFWSNMGRVNASMDIMVPPHYLAQFQETMNNLQMSSELMIPNVQSLIDSERRSFTTRSGFDWEDYYPLDEMYDWLDAQLERYPNVLTPISAGYSFEGREIRGVKVSYKEGNRGVFIESGIHAREWITVATVTYILNELLTSEDTAVRNIAENFDWYIFPSINPDGYVYSFTSDRMWRKTRRPAVLCIGTDANRNWDFYWMDTGASNNPCVQTYAGNRVFSEKETQAVASYIINILDKIDVYLCFHSYSQLLMLPYGLDYEEADNFDTLMEIGEKAIKALAVRYGTEYKVGAAHDVIYSSSGASTDWVKKSLNVTYTFEWELRDTGAYGFLLPADQIIPSGEETLDSVVSILQDVQILEQNKVR